MGREEGSQALSQMKGTMLQNSQRLDCSFPVFKLKPGTP